MFRFPYAVRRIHKHHGFNAAVSYALSWAKGSVNRASAVEWVEGLARSKKFDYYDIVSA